MFHFKNLADGSIVLGATNVCPPGFELVESSSLPECKIEHMKVVDGSVVIDVDKQRAEKLSIIRARRDVKLAEADILINKAMDSNAANLDALKAHRIALRDVTERFKSDMSLLDIVDAEDFDLLVVA